MGLGERIDFTKVFKDNPPPDAYIPPLFRYEIAVNSGN